MLYILIIGCSMGAVSAAFWCIELLPFMKAVRSLPKPVKKKMNFFTAIVYTWQCIGYIFGFIGKIPLLWTLALDITCTLLLAGSLGFAGMIGGVIGLTISNIISIFLLAVSRYMKEESLPHAEGVVA